jgi:hypothetical protein
MASGLGGERLDVSSPTRPFCSAKVVDVKHCRLVEFVGNHERLGKNGRRCRDKDMEGERPFSVKAFEQQPPPYPVKSGGFGVGFNNFTLARRPASGGQPA